VGEAEDIIRQAAKKNKMQAPLVIFDGAEVRAWRMFNRSFGGHRSLWQTPLALVHVSDPSLGGLTIAFIMRTSECETLKP
jgi:hypothetical protein